MVTNKK